MSRREQSKDEQRKTLIVDWDWRRSWFANRGDHATCELIASLLVSAVAQANQAHGTPMASRVLVALHIGVNLGSARSTAIDFRDPLVGPRASELCGIVAGYCATVLACPAVHLDNAPSFHSVH